MRHAAVMHLHIHPEVAADRQLLDHYIRRNVEEMWLAAGVEERCEIYVEPIRDERGIVYLVSIEIGEGPDPTLVQEMNRDPFLAVRDAFDTARVFEEEHPSPLAAW